MNVKGKHYRTIWIKDNIVQIIDQRNLPHEFIIEDLKNVNEVATAIKDMHVRGAGLIGATAGYGMYLATLETNENFDESLKNSAEKLIATRPTAVNLKWAVDRQLNEIKKGNSKEEKIKIALKTANEIADEDSEYCRRLGEHGLKIIEEISKKKNGEPVNILTHCNTGWLAFVDYGSATAPIYAAYNKGIKVHVWVDETRPRNQGARLTAWELNEHGVPHTVIPDNVGGHLMQNQLVDLCIVGTDRTTHTGDVANKIGTYLKAVAAKDNNIPFYVALPSSTFDWELKEGKEIPIEQRGEEEVKYIQGLHDGEIKKVLLAPKESPATNYAFDVTPRRLITGLITERGICNADEESILNLYPEKKNMDEKGYIKFNCNWIKSEPKSFSKFIEINNWRNKLYDLGLIGVYPNGIGFGNISIRDNLNQFIITGSATGGIEKLSEQHYTKVTEFSLEKNSLTCEGPIKASSESLTHAAIYQTNPEVNVVIHVHNLNLWKKLINKIPTTSKDAEYGTPEMAKEIIRLFNETDVKEKKILAMEGHKEGIISFGNTMEEAGKILLNYFNI